ncbi:MAG: hypothetical protein BAJATHORv1_20208 [Candidatus Thorarchaeota archaeon]|nr:MAG: hypothetical protein BAJATHORv1_20208 [Candidatus Thorarchaeota archaeon]
MAIHLISSRNTLKEFYISGGVIEMDICVIGSCGKRKKTSSTLAPDCEQILKKKDLSIWREKLNHLLVPARDMYTGNQNRELKKGVDLLREIDDVSVDYFIISAGFGLLAENEPIPPYECSFSSMKSRDIQLRAKNLSIVSDFLTICEKNHDLMYLALGKSYLISLGSDWQSSFSGTLIAFDSKLDGPNTVIVPSGNSTVRSFSRRGYKIHGAAGFKGDLLRILANYVLEQDDSYNEISSWLEPFYLQQTIFSIGGI